MYRQYEDPRALEKQLKELRERYEYLRATGELDVEQDIDYQMEMMELEDRINFAWQDDEFEDMYTRGEVMR